MNVTFQLRHSDQATYFAGDRLNEQLTGELVSRYNDNGIVVVDGWRYAHDVPCRRLKPARRVHVFYYRHDSYGGPKWTWCKEISNEVHDHASGLRTYPNQEAALDAALEWLSSPIVDNQEVVGE